MGLNPGLCVDCSRITSRGPHGMCRRCAASTDGGLSMCHWHEVTYGRPDPDCEECREAGDE